MQQAATKPQSEPWSLELVSGHSLPESTFVLPVDTPVVVGRSNDADIVIPLEEISRQHAELMVERGNLRVKDLGSKNGTHLNGQPVDSALAGNGDEVSFERIRFRVRGPEREKMAATTLSPIAAPQREQADATTRVIDTNLGFLLGLSDPVTKVVFPLDKTPVTIGRDAGNDIVLNHNSISSRHAEMVRQGKQWLLRDLDSRNGTFLNGKKIQRQSIPIPAGSQIRVASVCLSYQNDLAYLAEPRLTWPEPAAASARTRLTKSSIALGVMLLACLLLLVAYPPPWMAPYLPDRAALASLRDYLNWHSAGDSLPELELTPTWQARRLPANRNAPTPMLVDLNGDRRADILVADTLGYVNAFDGNSGEPIFQWRSERKILSPPNRMTLQDQSTGVVLAHYDGTVSLLDQRGEPLWHSSPGLELGQLVHRPLIVDANGDGHSDIVLASANQGLVALDGSREGWMLWQTRALVRGRLSATPLSAELDGARGAMFVTVSDAGQVLALSLDGGVPKKLWEQQLDPIRFTSPALLKSGKRRRVAVITERGDLIALDAGDGSVIWQQRLQANYFASPLAGNADGDEHEDVYTVDAKGRVRVFGGLQGEPLWAVDIDREVQATPLLSDIDLDGRHDLALLDTAGGLSLLAGAGGKILLASYRPGESDSFAASPLLGDIDGNSRIDLITISQNGLLSSLTLNRRLETGTTPWPIYLGNEQHRFEN